MNKKNNKKNKVDWVKKWNTPLVVNGCKLTDEKLAEFLDWVLVSGNEDFDLFTHLDNEGYFKKHPVTSEKLKEAVMKRELGKK